MSFEGWRFFNRCLSESEILEELTSMQKEEEKIEAGDWVRVVHEYVPGLNLGEVCKVCYVGDYTIVLWDGRCGWNKDRFELIRKHDAPFKVGDKIKSRILGTEFELNHATSVFSLNENYKKYYYLVEPVESIQYKKEKEKMCISTKNRNEEYKLRFKQVKDFSVKDLEEAGACETALLKILKDKQCLYEIPFRYGYWNELS